MRFLVGAGALAAILMVGPAFAQFGGTGGSIGGVGDAANQMQPSTTGLGSVEGYPRGLTGSLNPRSPDYGVVPLYSGRSAFRPSYHTPYGYQPY